MIPDTLPLGDESHRMAEFAIDPASSISMGQENWEDVLNPMMHRAFGYGAVTEGEGTLRGLARRGEYDLDGFLQFIEYFIVHCRVQGGLFEGKVKILLAPDLTSRTNNG
jgi:hypothetical protein